MGRGTCRLPHRHADSGLSPHRAGARALSRRRAPERLPGLVDAHCHLQHAQFEHDRDAVIERAAAAGLERLLVPGWDLASSESALELAARYPDLVQAAVGIHPHDAAGIDEAGWAHLEALARDRHARAVGEIGLDYFRTISPPQVQRAAFERQLGLAETLGLPIIIHDREAHADVTAALLAWRGRPDRTARGMLHAFSGDAAMAERLTDAGFLVSFALPVAFRSSTGPRAAARALPEGRFVVETDAPYLGPDRERRNEPPTTLRVVAELARLRETEAAGLIGPIRQSYEALIAE